MHLQKNILILLILLGLFGCKNNKKNDYVFDTFKSQIEKNGLKIDSVDNEGLIYVSKGEFTIKVSLENVRRDFARDKDENHISNLVKTILSNSLELSTNWQEVKDKIYISLFPNDHNFQDFLHTKITDIFSKVYVVNETDKLIWITNENLKNWNKSEVELDKQANLNADILLEKTNITFDTIENHKLGMIESEDATLKGALLFAPTLKEKVKKDFGFPFYAVIPVRDFCYIFSEKDYDFFAERIGRVVVDEYKKSGYPITNELLKFTNKGVVAFGEYPIE